MPNSVDLDEMPHSAASHLGLHCLLRPIVRIHMVNTGCIYFLLAINPSLCFLSVCMSSLPSQIVVFEIS